MKTSTIKAAIFAVTIASITSTPAVSSGGVYAKCAAWDQGQAYVFVNGNVNQNTCFSKARKYFQNSVTWEAKYYNPARLILGTPVVNIVRN